MVVLFHQVTDQFFRDILGDHNRGTGLEGPVILIDLVSQTNDTVCVVLGIVLIDLKLASQIKEEDLRVTFHVIVRISNDRIRVRFFQREKISVRLPQRDLFIRLQKLVRIHGKIVIQFSDRYTVILIQKIRKLQQNGIEFLIGKTGICEHQDIDLLRCGDHAAVSVENVATRSRYYILMGYTLG